MLQVLKLRAASPGGRSACPGWLPKGCPGYSAATGSASACACEPKRLRYRLLHVAARLAFHARQAILHLNGDWPWARELAVAFARLAALPPPTR